MANQILHEERSVQELEITMHGGSRPEGLGLDTVQVVMGGWDT
jgi:hypothetical protein